MNKAEGHFWRSKFVVEERYVTPVTRRRLYISASVLIVLGAVFFTIVLTGVLSQTG